MTQYIDKDALVAKIERKMEERDNSRDEAIWNNEFWPETEYSYRDKEDEAIIDLINTLEVKEVDLERYYNEYFKGWTDYQGIDSSVTNQVGCCVTLDDIKDACRHFFALGLKVKQG